MEHPSFREKPGSATTKHGVGTTTHHPPRVGLNGLRVYASIHIEFEFTDGYVSKWKIPQNGHSVIGKHDDKILVGGFNASEKYESHLG